MTETGFKEEKKFALICLRNFLLSGNFALKDGLSGNSLANLDWNFIVRVAAAHRLLPFLTLSLLRSELIENVPPLMGGLLRENLKQAVMENLVKMEEFQKIRTLFEKRGISIAPLKGVALTHEIYSETPVRQMGDIDILIRDEDMDKAKQLLFEADFELKEGFNRWQTSLTNSLLGRSGYWRDGLDVDLQWRPQFVFGGNSIGWDAARAWQRTKPCLSLGKNVFLLSPEDNLQYLLFQVCNDWEARRLFWVQLLDLAAVVKKNQIDVGSLIMTPSKNLPGPSKKKLELFASLLKECFFEDRDYNEFSTESREILEYFFNHLPIVLEGFSGKDYLKGASSVPKKLIFLLGYLFPSRWWVKNQYGGGTVAFFRTCLNHWKRLLLKFFQLISGTTRSLK